MIFILKRVEGGCKFVVGKRGKEWICFERIRSGSVACFQFISRQSLKHLPATLGRVEILFFKPFFTGAGLCRCWKSIV